MSKGQEMLGGGVLIILILAALSIVLMAGVYIVKEAKDIGKEKNVKFLSGELNSLVQRHELSSLLFSLQYTAEELSSHGGHSNKALQDYSSAITVDGNNVPYWTLVRNEKTVNRMPFFYITDENSKIGKTEHSVTISPASLTPTLSSGANLLVQVFMLKKDTITVSCRNCKFSNGKEIMPVTEDGVYEWTINIDNQNQAVSLSFKASKDDAAVLRLLAASIFSHGVMKANGNDLMTYHMNEFRRNLETPAVDADKPTTITSQDGKSTIVVNPFEAVFVPAYKDMDYSACPEPETSSLRTGDCQIEFVSSDDFGIVGSDSVSIKGKIKNCAACRLSPWGDPSYITFNSKTYDTIPTNNEEEVEVIYDCHSSGSGELKLIVQEQGSCSVESSKQEISTTFTCSGTSCTSWTESDCGGGTCNSLEREYVCDSESSITKCVSDSACKPAGDIQTCTNGLEGFVGGISWAPEGITAEYKDSEGNLISKVVSEGLVEETSPVRYWELYDSSKELIYNLRGLINAPLWEKLNENEDHRVSNPHASCSPCRDGRRVCPGNNIPLPSKTTIDDEINSLINAVETDMNSVFSGEGLAWTVERTDSSLSDDKHLYPTYITITGKCSYTYDCPPCDEDGCDTCTATYTDSCDYCAEIHHDSDFLYTYSIKITVEDTKYKVLSPDGSFNSITLEMYSKNIVFDSSCEEGDHACSSSGTAGNPYAPEKTVSDVFVQ